MTASNRREKESLHEDLQAKMVEAMDKVAALDQLLALSNKEIASRDGTIRMHAHEIASRDETNRSHAQEIEYLQVGLSKCKDLLAQSEKDKKKLESQHASALASLHADCQKAERACATLEDTVKHFQLQSKEVSKATAQYADIAHQMMTWNEQLKSQTRPSSASNAPLAEGGDVAWLLAMEKTKSPSRLANKEHHSQELQRLFDSVTLVAAMCKEHDTHLRLRLEELHRSKAELEALQTSSKASADKLTQTATWVRLLVDAVTDIAKNTEHHQQSCGKDLVKVDTLISPGQAGLASPTTSITSHEASLAEEVNQALRTAAALLQERGSHTRPDKSCAERASEATKAVNEQVQESEALLQAARAELAELRKSEGATKLALLDRERRIACLEESLALITSIAQKQEEAIKEACSAQGKLHADNKQLLDEKLCATADLEAALKELEESRDELETANANISDLQQHVQTLELSRSSSSLLKNEGQFQGRHLLQRQSDKGKSAMTRPSIRDTTASNLSCLAPAMAQQSPSTRFAISLDKCSEDYSAQSNFEAAQNALETMRLAIAQAAHDAAEGRASKQQSLSLATKLQESIAKLEEAQNLRRKDMEEIQMLQDTLRECRNHEHDKAAFEAASALARELEDELQCSNQAVQDLQHDLATVQRSLQTERDRVQHLQSTIAELERGIADSRKKESCLEADILRAKGTLRDQAHEVERGLKQIQELQEQLGSTWDDLSRTKATNLEAESTISSQQMQIQKLEHDLCHSQLREKQSAERLTNLEHDNRSRYVSMEKLDEELTLTQRHARFPT